jgi:hypothetical protein
VGWELALSRARVNLDTLGLETTGVRLSHSDKRLASLLNRLANAMRLPLGAVNVDGVGTSDSEQFAERKTSCITVHSVTQETWPILHSSRDTLQEHSYDDYCDTYQLLVGYLVLLEDQLTKNPTSKLWETSAVLAGCIVRDGFFPTRRWNMLDHGLLKTVAEQLLGASQGQLLMDGQTEEVTRVGSGKLLSVRFKMNGRDLQAIEQNPEKPSRWGKLARDGHQVVQFRDVLRNRYLAVSVDGEVKEYGKLGRD